MRQRRIAPPGPRGRTTCRNAGDLDRRGLPPNGPICTGRPAYRRPATQGSLGGCPIGPSGASPVDVEKASEAFPLAALIEALDALLADPGPERTRQATAALRTLLTTAGADGAYPRDRRAAAAAAAGWAQVPWPRPRTRDDRSDIIRIGPGQFDGQGAPSGVLWLDGPTDPGETVARLIGHALEGAWSRAKVVQASERLAALDAATRGIANVLELDAVLHADRRARPGARPGARTRRSGSSTRSA